MNDLLLGLAYLAVVIFNTHTLAVSLPGLYVEMHGATDKRWRVVFCVSLFLSLALQVFAMAGVIHYWGL